MYVLRHGTLPVLLCLVLLLSVLTGCKGEESGGDLLAKVPEDRSAISKELTYDHSLKLTYADQFAVDSYKEGGSLITVCDGRQYYLPDAETPVIPSDLPEDISVLPAPVENGYLAGTACMDFFASFDALSQLGFSSLQEKGWKIPEAAEAMHRGDIRYAGKYSTPDYELLTSNGCDLAIENTMIYHTPDVIDQLESLGIPVFIDHSSNESTPQARMEWVKLYGLLTGREKQANKAFRAQEKEFLGLPVHCGTGLPRVAFFSVRSNGTVTVRRASDYIPAMIGLAGGEYAFKDLGAEDDSNRSTQVISMEEFYQTAKDADWFIYNSSIEGERNSLDDLLKDAPVLADCKAVKEGHVYCTTADLYQHTMGQGTFVRDLYEMLTGGSEFTYLFELK